VSPQTALLRSLALVALAIGPALLCALLLIAPSSPLRRTITRYIDHLDEQFRFLRSRKTGQQVLLWQLAGFIVVALLTHFVAPVLVVFEFGVVFGPWFQIRQLREKRTIRLESQLDAWLLILANALKAVPSIGDALASSQALMHEPMSQELDVALKEYALGTPLDIALHNMGARLKSRVITTALTMLQVARRTGGDLPSTLETSAASLRELARLEGVVRTKTADGRNQAFVLGALPAVIFVALYFIQPDLIMPLFESFKGNLLLAIAIALWLGAIAAAIRILKVDI
jgi:tight adherence protein B